MKKVLFLITQAEMGGAQKYVIELASYFAKNKIYDVSVASEDDEYLKKNLAKAGIKFTSLKHLKRSIANPFLDLFALSEIFKLIKSEKPDIVHANSSKMGVLAALAGKAAKVPKIIFTAHGWVFNEILPFHKKWFYIFATWFSGLFQDKIICVSSYDKKRALHYHVAKEKKLSVINIGIDEESIRFVSKKEAREFLKLPEDKRVLGCIANLYENKGIKYLIEAAYEILKKRKDVVFAIIGFGPEKKYLENLIYKLGIEKSFLLLGAKENAFLYIKAFDIFILPSQKEGFPYTLLEAGLAKLPVITTNAGGIPDITDEENSVTVVSRDSTQLEGAIANLIEDKEKQKIISENIYKDVKAKFSFKRMAEKTIEIYEN